MAEEATAPPSLSPTSRRHLVVDTFRRAGRGVDAVRSEDTFLYAASLAFYGLISVVPLVVVALWITSLVVGPARIDQAAVELARVTPAALGADQALQRVADLGTSTGLLAVFAALWPATAYGSALVRVLDRLSGEAQRNRLRRRGAALALVGAVPLLVLGSLVASYAGTVALGDSTMQIALGLIFAFLFGFVATAVTVGFIYRVFPRTPFHARSTMLGSFIAAAGISVLSVGYVAYLRLGTDFQDRYASHALAAVVLLGLWLFAANAALLLGFRAARARELRVWGTVVDDGDAGSGAGDGGVAAAAVEGDRGGPGSNSGPGSGPERGVSCTVGAVKRA